MQMPPSPRLPVLIALFPLMLMLSSVPSGAHAICSLVATQDGRVPLRAAPRSTAPIVYTMRSGFEIMTEGAPADHQRSWTRVTYWLDRVHPDVYVPGRMRHGWVATSALRGCDA